MKVLEESELYQVRGGFNITGAILSSFSRIIETLYNIGRNLGTSIYMIKNKKKC